MELVVPPDDDKPLPTLGDQVCAFIEERAVYGPGDLKGQRVVLSEDWRYCLYRLYEHWPRGHPRAGRRRFKKGRLSVRKGAAKTELMAFVAFVELHPEAPVRFNGFNRDGSLKEGRPVVDPFIPMLANAKLQVSELAFGALKLICEECDDADLFDCTLDRIIRLDDRGRADGKALPLANAPDTNDGGRTTCNLYDETHRLYLPSEKAAVVTMEANLGKRPAQDPWSLGVTTAGEPGQQSQAEDDHFEAEATARGEIKRPRMFYFHRQASDGWDMGSFEERCEAIREASGPELAARTDIEDLASQWDVPKADVAYLERVWCNRWTQQGLQAFNLRRWRELRRPGARIPAKAMVTVGFDGARMRDATAFVVTDVRTGLQELAGLWERPHDADEDWEVDELEVNAKRAELFRRFRVVKMYADPPHWNYTVGAWAARNPDVVEEFWTNQRHRMIRAIQTYVGAMQSGVLGHDDDPETGDFSRHIGNAGKQYTTLVDPQTGERAWILGKLHKDRKFDAAMAAVLSWQARMDVLPKLPKPKKRVFRQIR
ncbi:terminase [Mycobacterium avium subsp. hominissuis]|nr:terminase [Mycobacterium avium subsp. hominissuis]MBZ4600354.1 terminase [Mycobacterium avium subsp. hominissuis]